MKYYLQARKKDGSGVWWWTGKRWTIDKNQRATLTKSEVEVKEFQQWLHVADISDFNIIAIPAGLKLSEDVCDYYSATHPEANVHKVRIGGSAADNPTPLWRVWRLDAEGRKQWFCSPLAGKDLCDQLLAVQLVPTLAAMSGVFHWSEDKGSATRFPPYEAGRVLNRVLLSECGCETVPADEPEPEPLYRVWMKYPCGEKRWFSTNIRGESLFTALMGQALTYLTRPAGVAWFPREEYGTKLTRKEAGEVASRISRNIKCGIEPVDPPEELPPGFITLPPDDCYCCLLTDGGRPVWVGGSSFADAHAAAFRYLPKKGVSHFVCTCQEKIDLEQHGKPIQSASGYKKDGDQSGAFRVEPVGDAYKMSLVCSAEHPLPPKDELRQDTGAQIGWRDPKDEPGDYKVVSSPLQTCIIIHKDHTSDIFIEKDGLQITFRADGKVALHARPDKWIRSKKFERFKSLFRWEPIRE